MSRKSRENKLREGWRHYLTRGRKWTREQVAKKFGVRVEDVQRLIDESGPAKVAQIYRGWPVVHLDEVGKVPRWYEGQLPPVRSI